MERAISGAVAGAASQAAMRCPSVICRTFGRSTSGVRKLRSTKRPMARPILSLLFGMMAVWGIGNRSGRRKSAVTANQSAIPPTMPASAPDWMSSVTNPGPGTIRVATNTTPMPVSIVVASIRFRRSRLRAASSDPGARSGIGLLANAGTYAAGDSRSILPCPFGKFDPAWDSHRKPESFHDWDRGWRSWHSPAMFIVDLFKSRRRLLAENFFLPVVSAVLMDRRQRKAPGDRGSASQVTGYPGDERVLSLRQSALISSAASRLRRTPYFTRRSSPFFSSHPLGIVKLLPFSFQARCQHRWKRSARSRTAQDHLCGRLFAHSVYFLALAWVSAKYLAYSSPTRILMARPWFSSLL